MALGNSALSSRVISIRDVASLLGKMTSSLVGVRYGKMHYRGLERCKVTALKEASGDYNASMCLDAFARDDIIWWRDNIKGSFNCFVVSASTSLIVMASSSLRDFSSTRWAQVTRAPSGRPSCFVASPNALLRKKEWRRHCCVARTIFDRCGRARRRFERASHGNCCVLLRAQNLISVVKYC